MTAAMVFIVVRYVNSEDIDMFTSHKLPYSVLPRTFSFVEFSFVD